MFNCAKGRGLVMGIRLEPDHGQRTTFNGRRSRTDSPKGDHGGFLAHRCKSVEEKRDHANDCGIGRAQAVGQAQPP